MPLVLPVVLIFALEVGGAVPDEGPRDHPPDAVGAGQHLAGDAADAVQLGHRHKRLVGRHLKDAVGAGVDDQGVLGHGLLAVVFQHLGAGVGLVAQHLVAGLCLKGGDQLGREPVREGGQRLRADHAGDLPVADGGVLAHAGLLQPGVRPDGGGVFGPGVHPVDVEQAQTPQVGAVKGGVAGDGGQGVGPLVPKGRRVRLSPDAEAVQYDQEYSFCHSRVLSAGRRRAGALRPVYHILQGRKSPACPVGAAGRFNHCFLA